MGECNEPEYGAFNTLIPRAATVEDEEDILGKTTQFDTLLSN